MIEIGEINVGNLVNKMLEHRSIEEKYKEKIVNEYCSEEEKKQT